MPWIPYYRAISKNLTNYPKKGDKVLYKARDGKNPAWYTARIERVINLRRYIVRYEVPEKYRCHFASGTTSAIVKLDSLSFFCSQIDSEDIYPPEKQSTPEQSDPKQSDPEQSDPEKK